ncbi:MAG: diguanylate cyclase domain-containing protein, partial [Guyparkeria sp.]
ALTGLPNRRLFRERLQHELDRARRSGAAVALLLFDLDRFKDVNDSLGHDQGDALLVEVAKRMVGRVRSTDVVARMGGDEVAYVSASVGVTLVPSDGDSIEALLKNADQALYAAKDAGRGRWSYFAPEMQAAALEKRALVRDLRAALEARTLELAFQPIVDLRTGAVVKV